jgi:hypothetical protein
MSDRPDKSARNRLFVEGADDFHVICALVKKAGVSWTRADQQIPFAPGTSGDRNAIKEARVAFKAGHPRVGLVVDADVDPRSRWAGLKREFDEFTQAPCSLVLPSDYPDSGVIADSQDGRRLGIWIMPDGKQSGAVEGLLASLVPRNDLWIHATESTHLARLKGALFADKDHTKAELRAWLAWQQAPGSPYGRAIELGYLGASSPLAGMLVNWFKKLFSP